MWRPNRYIAPDEEHISRGTKLFCQIDRKGRLHGGSVRNEQGIVLWRFSVRKNPFGHTFKNPFNKRDFIVADADAKNEVVIRRASFMPPAFYIIERDSVIGGIKMRSVFRNKYSIWLDGVNSWTFRMPLYTIHCYAYSSAGPEVWVAVGPSKTEWSILIKTGVKAWPLIAALTFIHNEWWNYG